VVRPGNARAGVVAAYEFTKAHHAEFPVATCCRVLSVSTSGYYAWLARQPSIREVSDRELTERILAIFEESRRTYGAPRITKALAKDHDIHVGKTRVARLMRAAGIAGVRGAAPGPPRRLPTARHPQRTWSTAPSPPRPPTGSGWRTSRMVPPRRVLDLPVVLDACSRKVVGWATSLSLATELVLSALDRALPIRRPEGVIHHSDHGSQSTSVAFGERCRRAGVRPSMGTVGDCFDHALCESFFATLECELLDRTRCATHEEASRKLFFIHRELLQSQADPLLGRRSHADRGRASLRRAGQRTP
jgi:putative transposase